MSDTDLGVTIIWQKTTQTRPAIKNKAPSFDLDAVNPLVEFDWVMNDFFVFAMFSEIFFITFLQNEEQVDEIALPSN
ncbi:MAG: hypothetical protein HKL80_12035 [Acidimicrobiales bacterium]|nr:hypothetical protein [Acidimicrobiales bacterium]